MGIIKKFSGAGMAGLLLLGGCGHDGQDRLEKANQEFAACAGRTMEQAGMHIGDGGGIAETKINRNFDGSLSFELNAHGVVADFADYDHKRDYQQAFTVRGGEIADTSYSTGYDAGATYAPLGTFVGNRTLKKVEQGVLDCGLRAAHTPEAQ